MRKVALISDGWKRLTTYAWVAGIMGKIKEKNSDVSLFQYNSYGNWSQDLRHNDGEYNIYRLPKLEEYDGIILDCNNIAEKDRLQQVITLLRSAKVPVVSITCAIDGFYYVGNDNRSAIIQMVEHLYQEHGCRTFLFAGGPKDSTENGRRVQGFLEALEKYGLPAEESQILYGDYDYGTGVRYMEELAGKELPDAIVCANDNIAAGLCAKAQELGLRIPEDMRVTGFDDLDKAAFFSPQITTVSVIREEIGAKAMEVLMDIWDGKEPDQISYVSQKMIFTESCGCPNTNQVDYREYIKNKIAYEVKRQNEEEELKELESRMAQCSDFTGIFQEMAEYLGSLSCDGFYVAVDRELYEANPRMNFAVEGYRREKMVAGCGLERGKSLDFQSLEELQRHLETNGSASAYMVTPIHFREYAVGFSVMKNGTFLYDNPYYHDMHSTFVNAVENLYKHLQMENMNRRLKDMYNRDPMTGLYNRIAYTEVIAPKYRVYCQQGRVCGLAFLDVDDFKIINDTHGHEYGDWILIQIAEQIRRLRPEDGYAYRFGGDEFIVFFPDATKSQLEIFEQRMQENLSKYHITVSIGSILTDPSDGRSLDEYLAMADKVMYKKKSEKKN